MPELPEAQTTVNGLKRTIIGKTIEDVWSDFHMGTKHGHKQNLKSEKYFKAFKKKVVGARIKSVDRKGKNILIHLDNENTVVVHMKMTGHLMYGASDKFVHLIFKLKKARSTSPGQAKDLVLSDMRKFANVSIIETEKLDQHEGLKDLGPDPLREISVTEFIKRIKNKKKAPIKKVLLDQTVVAGIGNIYSDEILWASDVHPESKPEKIPEKILKKMFENTRKILKKSIKAGGDSTSDYRNAYGGKGSFQNLHQAYQQTGEKCYKTGCGGIIKRKVIAGRSAHFCPKHQIIY